MCPKAALISQITDAMETELSPGSDQQFSIGDIERRVEELHDEMQTLLEQSAKSGGFSAYADQFRAITDEVNALNAKRVALEEQRQQNTAVNYRIQEAQRIMADASQEVTEWDEQIIRQLVSTVKVLNAEKDSGLLI